MSVFSRIWTEYEEMLRISPYSVRMRENTNQKLLHIWTLFTQCICSKKHWMNKSLCRKQWPHLHTDSQCRYTWQPHTLRLWLFNDWKFPIWDRTTSLLVGVVLKNPIRIFSNLIFSKNRVYSYVKYFYRWSNMLPFIFTKE